MPHPMTPPGAWMAQYWPPIQAYSAPTASPVLVRIKRCWAVTDVVVFMIKKMTVVATAGGVPQSFRLALK